MAFYKVNKIIILRMKPSSIRFKKDLHSAVNSVSASKKSAMRVSPRKVKPSKKNSPHHPTDLSLKKSLSSYIPDPMTKTRSLAGQSLVTDFKSSWLDLSILNFDKFKGVTSQIKKDLLSVDDVKELISFKPNEYIQDLPDKNKNFDDNMNSVRDIPKFRSSLKYHGDKSAEIDNFENYEKDSLISTEKFYKPSKKNYKDLDRCYDCDLDYEDRGLRDRNSAKSFADDQHENIDENTVYVKSKNKNYYNKISDNYVEFTEFEDDSNEYRQKKFSRRTLPNSLTEEVEAEESNSFSVDLLPVDENTKELIAFKPHEKVTMEELAEVNQLGGKLGPIETLLKNRIRPYKPKNNEKWPKKRNSYGKHMDKNKRREEFDDNVDAFEMRNSKQNPIIKYKTYEKNPEKIAKFRKIEEFEEIDEDELTNNRTLRKKNEDSIYYPSFEEYERASKNHRDT